MFIVGRSMDAADYNDMCVTNLKEVTNIYMRIKNMKRQLTIILRQLNRLSDIAVALRCCFYL